MVLTKKLNLPACKKPRAEAVVQLNKAALSFRSCIEKAIYQLSLTTTEKFRAFKVWVVEGGVV